VRIRSRVHVQNEIIFFLANADKVCIIEEKKEGIK
jgi:hypothetical protein